MTFGMGSLRRIVRRKVQLLSKQVLGSQGLFILRVCQLKIAREDRWRNRVNRFYERCRNGNEILQSMAYCPVAVISYD